jgi:protein TonB
MMSFAVHALLLGLAVYASSRPKAATEKLRAVTFINAAPPPPPPPPPPPAGGGAKKPKTEPKKVQKKPDTIVETKKVEKEPEKPPTPDPQPEGQVGGVVGGVAGGVVGGTVGGVVGGKIGGVVGGTGTDVIPFGAGMVKPTMLEKPDIRFSREAAAAHISGVALLKCVIEIDGRVDNCKIMKGLPYMEPQILEGVKSIRYTPVMYNGHPQRVEMTIPLRIQGS